MRRNINVGVTRSLNFHEGRGEIAEGIVSETHAIIESPIVKVKTSDITS
jgi:hypothetical protein